MLIFGGTVKKYKLFVLFLLLFHQKLLKKNLNISSVEHFLIL